MTDPTTEKSTNAMEEEANDLPNPIDQPPSSTVIAFACATTTAVSVAMILLNKAIVLSIPFGGGLVLVQNAATVILIQAHRWGAGPKDIGFKTILLHTPCAILFGLSTFTSIQSLAYLSITTFTIFRNAQSLLSFPMDYALRGECLKPVSVFFLFTILLGTCAYCGEDMRANIEGIAWASAHLVCTTLYTVLTKIKMESGKDEQPATKTKASRLAQVLDLAWYNNILSLPLISGAAVAQAIHMAGKTPLVREDCGLSCWIMVAASCFSGCAMSVVGLNTQSLMSPTSFLTFNNLNKIPAMLISAAIWPHLETANSTQEVMGIVLSLLGGYLYALSRQGNIHPAAMLVSVAMSLAIIPLMILGETSFIQTTNHANSSHTNSSIIESLIPSSSIQQ